MENFQFPIEPASREWRRQFANVARSFAKTVTEAVTNSDTSYKRKFALPDTSGLVDLILKSPKGTRFDSSALKSHVPKSAEREIHIHVYTAQGHGRPTRSCDIVDFAEGLSSEEVEQAFRLFADDKTEVSKGRPGRSLFGRGISDVLLGHKQGELYSYKGGVLTYAKFQFDAVAGKPGVVGEVIHKPAKEKLREVHLKEGSNGTCIRFSLDDDCTIPDEGTLLPLLSRFYMLRLINSDPSLKVRVFRYRAAGKIYEDTVEYDFPLGDVIGNFASSLDVPKDLTKRSFPPLKVEGMVYRAAVDAPLKGRESRDSRENGILIVDENDAVLDLTFLPDFEGAPYLNKICGVLRLSGIRPIFEHFLNRGKESPLTTTRDGFDPKHEFTQFLFGSLKKHLEPIYRKEEQRYNESSADELSGKAKQRLDDALRHLNRYLNELMGSGEDGDGGTSEPKDVPIQFIPEKTKLIVARARFVALLVRASDAKTKGSIMIDSSNPKIEAFPNLVPIDKGATYNQFRSFRISVKCDSLHESATITALADGNEGTLESKLQVEDVTTAPQIEPPLEMEFRPNESKGQPNKRNHAGLYVNLQAVPLGRKIDVSIVKSQGGILLFDLSGKKCQQLGIKLEPGHQIGKTNVARVPVPWCGSAWGQFARIIAETKTPAGKVATATCGLVIDQPEEGGLIKDVRYRDLGNQKSSDLVDGVIYINSSHSLNRSVFGATQEDYKKRVETDRTAQFRQCGIIVEQGVYRLAEELYIKDKLRILPTAPVTSIREFVDAKTHQFAPKLLNILVSAR